MEKQELQSMDEMNVNKLLHLAKDGKIEVVIRHGKAKELLPEPKPLEPIRLELSGQIGTVSEFLSKRNHLFTQSECHIKVSTEHKTITFVGNECQNENKFPVYVYSELKNSKDYDELNVNNNKEFEALELAKYLRTYKNLFVDKKQFNDVFAALSSFKAEISRRIEKSDDRTGNAATVIKQEVTHNMPKVFSLVIKPFANIDKSIEFEVEVDINPNDLKCSLLSFDLDEKYNSLAESIINQELEQSIGPCILRDYCVTFFS